MRLQTKILLALNVFSAITGLLCFFCGIAYMQTYDQIGDLMKLQKRIRILLPMMLTLFGLVMIGKSGTSIYCTITEESNLTLLIGFLALSILSFMLAGILVLYRRISFNDAITNSFNRFWSRRQRKSYVLLWDKLQRKLNCCGIFDWRDWGDLIPKSCTDNVNDGCLEAVKMYAEHLSWTSYYNFAISMTNFLKNKVLVYLLIDSVIGYFVFKGHFNELYEVIFS